MSIENAKRLVGDLQLDESLALQVLSQPKSLREETWQRLGFDCTESDVEAYHTLMTQHNCSETSLPKTWQCGGPCHTKCAPMSLDMN